MQIKLFEGEGRGNETPKIISASRRTDIPRFYGQWFAERRRAGVAEFRNAFGREGSVSLRDKDVLGYLFWTKFAGPFHDNLAILRHDGVPYIFQYTITGNISELEANIPERSRVIEDFLRLREGLPSSRCIQWRYDPIVFSASVGFAEHLQRFEEIATELEGATDVVNISFVEPYLRAIGRIDDPSVKFRQMDPKRHKAASKRYPNLPQLTPDEVATFVADLSAVAANRGMELRSCANPELEIPAAQCCGADMFLPYGERVVAGLAALKKAPTRRACRCLGSVDIGMDNTCVGGCRYCYVVNSPKTALENYRKHDPNSPRLRS